MRRLLMFCLAGIALLTIGATPALAGNGKKAKKNYTYKITFTNLTTTQPLAPPVAAVHTKYAKIWQRGRVASHAVVAVAEDANNQILVDAGSKLKGVKSIVSATDTAIGPDETAMFEVVAKGKYNRLSLISMLVKTNDAFTGVNSVRLNRGKTIRVFNKGACDAGSEANNQLSSHIPGVGNQFVHDAEGNVIRKHPGIQPGIGDIEIQDAAWIGPVAEITIERLAKS